ncbi:MAG: hypothetical protein AABZ47_18010 [Planctomycetota bacterium]
MGVRLNHASPESHGKRGVHAREHCVSRDDGRRIVAVRPFRAGPVDHGSADPRAFARISG